MANESDVPANLRAEPMRYERYTRRSAVSLRNEAIRQASAADTMQELKDAADALQVDTSGARSKKDLTERIQEAVTPTTVTS